MAYLFHSFLALDIDMQSINEMMCHLCPNIECKLVSSLLNLASHSRQLILDCNWVKIKGFVIPLDQFLCFFATFKVQELVKPHVGKDRCLPVY